MQVKTALLFICIVLFELSFSYGWGYGLIRGLKNMMDRGNHLRNRYRNHRHGHYYGVWTPGRWRPRFSSGRFSTDKELIEAEIKAAKAKGPNVCVERRFSGSSKTCVTEDDKSNCTTKRYYRTVYKCCPNYATQIGQRGCPRELYTSTKNISEVAKELGLNILLDLVTTAGLAKTLSTGGPFTLFAPTDDAFKALGKDVVEKLKTDPKTLSKILLFHITTGKVLSTALKDDTKIETLNAPNKVRVNIFSRGRILIVQGARIVRSNQGAKNGIIHVINKVITPTTKTIAKVLASTKSLKMLHQAIKKSGLSLPNPVTVFAPSDEAFSKIPPTTLARILNSPACLKNLLKNHVVSESVFTTIIQDDQRAFTRTELGSTIKITKTAGVVKVNNATVTTADVLVTDGVLQVIDEVLVPNSALSILDVAEKGGATEVVKLIKKAGLDKLLRGDEKFTLFAPTNEAINALPNEIKAKLGDPEVLKKVLLYHVVSGSKKLKDFRDEELIETLDKPNKIRINVYHYGQIISAQGSCMVARKCDSEACNGVLHFLSKVMLPPSKTILEIINSDKKFSTLATAVEKAGLNKDLNGTKALTIFAPTNEAFKNLPSGSLEKLFSDPSKLKNILLYHVMPGSLFSCALPRNCRLMTLSGEKIKLTRTRDGVKLNDAKVIDADVGVTNGVLYSIDKVLREKPQLMSFWDRYFSNVEMMFDEY